MKYLFFILSVLFFLSGPLAAQEKKKRFLSFDEMIRQSEILSPRISRIIEERKAGKWGELRDNTLNTVLQEYCPQGFLALFEQLNPPYYKCTIVTEKHVIYVCNESTGRWKNNKVEVSNKIEISRRDFLEDEKLGLRQLSRILKNYHGEGNGWRFRHDDAHLFLITIRSKNLSDHVIIMDQPGSASANIDYFDSPTFGILTRLMERL